MYIRFDVHIKREGTREVLPTEKEKTEISPVGSAGSMLQAVQWLLSKVGTMPPRTPSADQKQRINEQRQTLPTKEEMLYFIVH
jgi:hypothetical protein